MGAVGGIPNLIGGDEIRLTARRSRPIDADADAADLDADRLAEDESRFADTFRQDHPWIWWATLVGPALLTAGMLAGVYLAHDGAYLQKLLATALATFFVFGRFVILGGVEGGGDGLAEAHAFLTRGELFLMVMWMDLAVASLLVYHQGFLWRLPLLGPRLRGLVADGRFILKRQPWIRRATFVGLVLFVTFPLAATGSVGGSIFGRLLGLSRGAALLGIALGSFLGCGAMYLGAGVINAYVDRDDPWLTYGGLAVILGLILLLNWRYRRMKAADRVAT